MEIYYLSVIFIFGLIVGSFLNVVIYWLESSLELNQKNKKQKRESLSGRSFCPYCKHQLGFFDLVPVLSWILLKGKCRYCGEKISLQYPLVEISTGIVFVTIFYFNQEILSTTGYWLLATGYAKLFLLLALNSLLITIFVYDFKHKIIPNRIIYLAIIIAICYLLFAIYDQNSLFFILYSLFSALGAGLFFYTIAYISNGKWMGGGDIKLAFLMGLVLGWPNIIVGLFLGFLLGAVVGLLLMSLKKAKGKTEIPFGPFLIVGTWVALFFGDQLVKWYLRSIGYW